MSLMNISIDGETFNVGIVKVTRKPRKETVDIGTTYNGTKHKRAIGTYFDYDVEINTKKCNVAEYDRLYEAITNPVSEHTVVLPYGQDTITILCDITVGNDYVVQDFNTFRRWSSLIITFNALELSKVAE